MRWLAQPVVEHGVYLRRAACCPARPHGSSALSSARKPVDEALRLASLSAIGVLDTPADARFDRLVELAAEHFSVPIALVSLVDDSRQWFKARYGLDVPQTSRQLSFCAHAILRPQEVMVVEDARADERFADNALVVGDPKVRFYAGAPILAEDGQPVGTLCVIDRSPRGLDTAGRRYLANLAASAGAMLELHRKNALLREAAALDPLTGLANRRAFDGALARAIDQAIGGVPFGLLCLDLDLFKVVNDTLGHDAGDLLLREVARRLTGAVRVTDVVARLGGDEFAVIVGGPADLDGVRTAARHILAAFAADLRIGANLVPIRASIGLAVAPVHGTSPASLLRAADQALYEAKRAGGQTLAVATRQERQPARLADSQEDALRAALASDGLELHWQPFFAAADGALVGCEALVRWNRPGHGWLAPAAFIPDAEKAGLIGALDAWVLRRACAEAASWPGEARVSVNISADWFSSGDIAGLVVDALARSGLAPGRLVLELTERTLVQHPEAARAGLMGLRALGVRTSLDDFGTGYSSLGYLYSFAFDEVKLDRSFVEGLSHNPRAEAVCRAVLDLGRALGMQVCAEGIETPPQLAFLREAGCNLLQGYLLGRPRPEPMLDASPLVLPDAG